MRLLYIMIALTCLAVSACVSRFTQTAVSIDQVSATSAILTHIGLAVVNICEQMFANMIVLKNCIYVSNVFA